MLRVIKVIPNLHIVSRTKRRTAWELYQRATNTELCLLCVFPTTSEWIMKSLFRPSWMHTLLAPCHRHLSSLPTMPSTFVTPEFIRFPYRFARYITCMRDICQPNSRKTLTLLLLCSNSHITCTQELETLPKRLGNCNRQGRLGTTTIAGKKWQTLPNFSEKRT